MNFSVDFKECRGNGRRHTDNRIPAVTTLDYKCPIKRFSTKNIFDTLQIKRWFYFLKNDTVNIHVGTGLCRGEGVC